jgi:hypothetical protein
MVGIGINVRDGKPVGTAVNVDTGVKVAAVWPRLVTSTASRCALEVCTRSPGSTGDGFTDGVPEDEGLRTGTLHPGFAIMIATSAAATVARHSPNTTKRAFFNLDALHLPTAR